jgi:hypothetical protein
VDGAGALRQEERHGGGHHAQEPEHPDDSQVPKTRTPRAGRGVRCVRWGHATGSPPEGSRLARRPRTPLMVAPVMRQPPARASARRGRYPMSVAPASAMASATQFSAQIIW